VNAAQKRGEKNFIVKIEAKKRAPKRSF